VDPFSRPAASVAHPAPPGGLPPGVDALALLADLRRLPAQRPTLLRIVQLTDDPDCSIRQLAQTAERDPAFTARMLQLANSAYYGRPGRVTSVVSAVTVLGAVTLRGLAVTMSLGLGGEHGPLPSGFWERAARTGAGSELVAPVVGASSGDAFCAGLLREVGQALLFRAAPEAYAALRAARDDAELPAAERAWCGTTSGELAGAALTASGLPAELGAAITEQQNHDETGTPLVRPLTCALHGGVVVARAVAAGAVDDAMIAALDEVTGGRLDADDLPRLALRAAARAAGLHAAMR
jgi:HD-like signal output (HDOD) protein